MTLHIDRHEYARPDADLERGVRWLIEADLSPRSAGAIRFGHWVRDRKPGAHRLTAFHCVDRRSEVPGDYPGCGTVVDRALQSCRASVEDLLGPDVFDQLIAVDGESGTQAATRLARARNTDIVVVGRNGPIHGWSLVHLGRIPRRLLRSLPAPVLVVPPDLDPDTLGRGPLVVGVVPHHHALPAIRLAERLAKSLDLSIELVHVLPRPIPMTASSISPGMGAVSFVPPYAVAVEERREKALRDWLWNHGLDHLPCSIERGAVASTLFDVARREHATMLVCGSRQLSPTERILESSVGSDVAAKAARPTLVVPPDLELHHRGVEGRPRAGVAASAEGVPPSG